MSHIKPEALLTKPASELAEMDSGALFALKNEAAAFLTAAKAISVHLDHALDLKYAQRAQALRVAAGKDTGIVHFDDGGVRITVDLPKKVEWDPKQLAQIAQRISANGEDPSIYMEISYKVAESKFNAWPPSLKNAFASARTLKTGKPGFRLALLEEIAR